MLLLAPAGDRRERAGDAVPDRDADVVRDGVLEDEAVTLPVFAHVADAVPMDRLVRVADVHRLPVHRDRAGGDPAEPEDGSRELRAARADEAVEGDDLPPVHPEIDRPVTLVRRDACEFQGCSLVVQSVAMTGRPLSERDAPAHHGCDHVGLRELVAVAAAENGGSVAQDSDGVAQREDLFQLVADEHDRRAAIPQAAEDAEEAVRLRHRERRRRFVEEEDPRLQRQGPSDLDELPLRDAQLGGSRAGVEVDPDLLQPRFGFREHRRVVDEPGRAGRVVQEEVLGYRELGHQVPFLIDGADTRADRILRTREATSLPGDDDRAAVGLVHAGDRLDQRRLAGTVLAEEGVDGAGPKNEVGSLQRRDPAVALPGALDPQRVDGVRFRCHADTPVLVVRRNAFTRAGHADRRPIITAMNTRAPWMRVTQ